MVDLAAIYHYQEVNGGMTMPSDYTPAELKLWITKLNDPQTSTDELQKIAMTLAHIDHFEALQALAAGC
jgi:hypothetical protein